MKAGYVDGGIRNILNGIYRKYFLRCKALGRFLNEKFEKLWVCLGCFIIVLLVSQVFASDDATLQCVFDFWGDMKPLYFQVEWCQFIEIDLHLNVG